MTVDVAMMERLAGLVGAPHEEINRRLSAEIAPAVPHRALAVFARACTKSPMSVRGDAAITEAVTVAELARLLPVVSARGPAVVRASLAGRERRLVVTVMRTAADPGLLVLVPTGADPIGERALSHVQSLWDLLGTRLHADTRAAHPHELATGRLIAAERERAATAVADEHRATLTALLRVLRSRDLDDRAARQAAIDISVRARLEADGIVARQGSTRESPVDVFGRLSRELADAASIAGKRLEFQAPAADAELPAIVAQGAATITRGCVLDALERPGVSRLHVSWMVGENLRITILDDDPRPPGRQSGDAGGRARALGGQLESEHIPGWGSRIVAQLPLRPPTGQVNAGLALLNPREAEVLELVARGEHNRQIGEALGISPNTVKFHLRSAMSKLGARTRSEAVAQLGDTLLRTAS